MTPRKALLIGSFLLIDLVSGFSICPVRSSKPDKLCSFLDWK